MLFLLRILFESENNLAMDFFVLKFSIWADANTSRHWSGREEVKSKSLLDSFGFLHGWSSSSTSSSSNFFITTSSSEAFEDKENESYCRYKQTQGWPQNRMARTMKSLTVLASEEDWSGLRWGRIVLVVLCDKIAAIWKHTSWRARTFDLDNTKLSCAGHVFAAIITSVSMARGMPFGEITSIDSLCYYFTSVRLMLTPVCHLCSLDVDYCLNTIFCGANVGGLVRIDWRSVWTLVLTWGVLWRGIGVNDIWYARTLLLPSSEIIYLCLHAS